MPRDMFIDPKTGAQYIWGIGHDEDEDFGKDRSITRTAPTSGFGLVRQEGDESPLVMRLSGSILAADQLQQMIAWTALSRVQTIYFKDFEDNKYEVIVTSFKPKRKRVVKNPRGGTTNPYNYWTYSIEMEVIKVLSGPWLWSL